jgi:hypothetical protein
VTKGGETLYAALYRLACEQRVLERRWAFARQHEKTETTIPNLGTEMENEKC